MSLQTGGSLRRDLSGIRHIHVQTNCFGHCGDEAMKTTIAGCLIALALAAGFGNTPAHAGDGGRLAAGVAVGTLLGLGIAGAYDRPRYYAPGPYYVGGGCYVGPRHCDWVGGSCWFNRFGERICGGGEYRCWRRRICD